MSQAVKKNISPSAQQQVKLTLTYTLVTVSALLSMELLFGAVFVSYLFTNNDRIQHADDAAATQCSPCASRFSNPEIPSQLRRQPPRPV